MKTIDKQRLYFVVSMCATVVTHDVAWVLVSVVSIVAWIITHPDDVQEELDDEMQEELNKAVDAYEDQRYW